MTKVTYSYGSPEYYKEQFDDLLADAQHGERQYGDAIVKGFLLSIADWKQYHKLQVDEYTRIEQRVREALTQ